MKNFDGLMNGELAKVERFAQKRDGTDSRVTGYSYKVTPDECRFVTVTCEICSHDMEQREDDVVLCVFMPDRRRSFIAKRN